MARRRRGARRRAAWQPRGARVPRQGERRLIAGGPQAGARAARGAPPCQFAADVAAHVRWAGTGQGGSRRRQRLGCKPPCVPGKGAPKAVSTAIPKAKMLAQPGCCFLLPIFGFANLLGRRALVGKLWGTSCRAKRFRAGAFAAHGAGWGDFSVFFASGSVAQAADPGYGDAGSGARWFAGRASAAGAEFNRPPPTGFFVPGAFT